MRYQALATDYDGTLAHHGRVDVATLSALERLRASRRRLLLVTGRQLPELISIFPEIGLFDRVVAENGAVIYRPDTHEEICLAEAPPEAFVEALRARGVSPLAVGRVIVATWMPHEMATLKTIEEFGLEFQLIFNKGAVMVLPSGINKAAGLRRALADLGLSAHNVVGVGDAENDHAFLDLCECGVAVANALPSLGEKADYVTRGDHGAGVIELIDWLIDTDLEGLRGELRRHSILLGHRSDGSVVDVAPHGTSILLAGTSGGGKSTLATGFLERLIERQYQVCVIDPEGEHENFEGAVVIGDAKRVPSADEVIRILEQPEQSAVVNLLGAGIRDRPAYFTSLFPRILELRARTGRPHWIVIDETHHLLPSSDDSAAALLPHRLDGILLITVHPERVARAVLSLADSIIAIGEGPEETIANFSAALKEEAPVMARTKLNPGEGILWRRRPASKPFWFRSVPPRTEHQRHIRKYAEGDLGPDRSFYFQGPDGKLNLRAQNLTMFLQLAEGIDEETWLHHLRKGDYSSWFGEMIKDPALAEETRAIESRREISGRESRELIQKSIERRYTAGE